MYPDTDAEGYLLNLMDWDEGVAKQIAARENLVLTSDHWVIIIFLRNFYLEYKIIPAMRVAIKELQPILGSEKSTSVYLQNLFPNGFFRQGCKLAGLPKPTRCT